VRWVSRPLLRRRRPFVSMADRNIAGRVGAGGQRCQRHRGEQKDLAPRGKHRCGEPERGFRPSQRYGRVVFHQSPHRAHPTATAEQVAPWSVAGNPSAPSHRRHERRHPTGRLSDDARSTTPRSLIPLGLIARVCGFDGGPQRRTSPAFSRGRGRGHA